MKLVSMTDFVFLMRANKNKDNIRRFWACEKYAGFLKQLLELWMFVPCKLVDGVWEVLDAEPCSLGMYEKGNPFYDVYLESKKEWDEAKERCLFDGFYNDINYVESGNISIHISHFKDKNIEWLQNTRYNIILTPTSIKQIGL